MSHISRYFPTPPKAEMTTLFQMPSRILLPSTSWRCLSPTLLNPILLAVAGNGWPPNCKPNGCPHPIEPMTLPHFQCTSARVVTFPRRRSVFFISTWIREPTAVFILFPHKHTFQTSHTLQGMIKSAFSLRWWAPYRRSGHYC